MSRRRGHLPFPATLPASLDATDVLDETEQDEHIRSFESADSTLNTLYRRVVLVLPGLSILYFLFHIFAVASVRQGLDDVASLASLVATIWILQYIPLSAGSTVDSQGRPLSYHKQMQGPIERYLPALNGVLSGLLGLSAVVAWRRGEIDVALIKAMPGMVYVAILVTRTQLVDVDVGSLRRARYGYTGA